MSPHLPVWRDRQEVIHRRIAGRGHLGAEKNRQSNDNPVCQEDILLLGENHFPEKYYLLMLAQNLLGVISIFGG